MSKRAARAAATCVLLGAAGVGAQQPYVDRVLDEAPQVVLKSEQELRDLSGWSRSWRAEYGWARDSGVFSGTGQTLAISGSIDTPQHGTLSLNGYAGRSRQDGSIEDRVWYWRADQFALPLAGGWLANHSIGQVPALQVPLARGFGRVGLPTSLLQGLAGEWSNTDGRLYTLAAGQPTVYSSATGVGSWTPSSGQLWFGGAQVQPRAMPGSTFALQAALTHGVTDASISTPLDSSGFWGAWRWEGLAPWSSELTPGATPYARPTGGLEVQSNLLHTESEIGGQPQVRAKGAWIDARWQTPLLGQHAGALYMQPGLRWGTYQLASDVRGAYWRGEYNSRQLYWDTSAEWADSISGLAQSTSYVSGSVRYRLDTRSTLVGTFARRWGRGEGASGSIGYDRATDWGQSYLHLEVLRASAQRAARIAMDHSFTVFADSSISTTLAYERREEFGRSDRAFIWGLVGTVRPLPRLVLDANLRGSNGDLNRVINGSLAATWELSPQWALVGQVSYTHGQDLQPLAVLSPITEAAQPVTPAAYSQRRVQFTLRYQDAAGRTSVALGGRPGAASGTLVGQVFQDENGNGRREATEAGVPEQVLRLDGRYVTRTDAQGRYSFPLVAVGSHRLELVKDNIPLPWNLPVDGAQRVEIRVRAESTVDFALKRE